MHLWNVAADSPARYPTEAPEPVPPLSWRHLRLVGGPDELAPSTLRNADDVRGCYRLRRLIEPELAAESCLLFDPAQLDELRSRIQHFTIDSEHRYAVHRAMHIELLRPAASGWDLRILLPLWDAVDRLAKPALGRSVDLITGWVAAGHDLLDAYGTRDPGAVRAASVRYLDRGERAVKRFVAPAS